MRLPHCVACTQSVSVLRGLLLSAALAVHCAPVTGVSHPGGRQVLWGDESPLTADLPNQRRKTNLLPEKPGGISRSQTVFSRAKCVEQSAKDGALNCAVGGKPMGRSEENGPFWREAGVQPTEQCERRLPSVPTRRVVRVMRANIWAAPRSSQCAALTAAICGYAS